MVRIRFRHLLPILAALTLWLPAQAQLHRGARTIVRGGMLVQRDSLASKTDSLADLSLVRELDSLMTGLFAADSAAVAELRTDDISKADSLYRLKMAGIKIESDTTKHKRGWLMSDSMSLSKVCWISTVLPGYGQIYNKQYWKLPVLYGTLGAGLALYLHENKTYKPLKREYEAYTNKNLSRTPELDALQSRMIRSNTRRQVYLGLTVASYIYFIDQRGLGRQESHHAGLHLPRRGTDLQQKLLESALRRGRFRRDDLLYRLEQPRLPAFQEGVQAAERVRTEPRQIP